MIKAECWASSAKARWKRTVRLTEGTLAVTQSTPLPGDLPLPDKRGNIALTVTRPAAAHAEFTLGQ